MDFITSEKAKRYIRTLAPCPRVDLNTLWTDSNKLAIDLIHKMLIFNPTKRITGKGAAAGGTRRSAHSTYSVRQTACHASRCCITPYNIALQDCILRKQQQDDSDAGLRSWT